MSGLVNLMLLAPPVPKMAAVVSWAGAVLVVVVVTTLRDEENDCLFRDPDFF